MSRHQLGCLDYNPFEGDRDSNCRTLRDCMIVARVPGPCQICFETIQKGARVRALTEVNYDDHKVMTFRFCPTCCEAMATSWTDDGRAIEARTAIGMAAMTASRHRPLN